MENKNKVQEKKSSQLFKVSGDWSKQSESLKKKYPKLTSEDLKFETGKEADLFKRLEKRLDKNREDVVTMLKKNQEASA